MTTYRIHPAIGIARVGNSPEGFFVGPERVGEFPDPPGGFKDAELRVKRQAARFRIFAHEDDRSFREITDAEAEITWTVHLANRKSYDESRDVRLTIDPGPRQVAGATARPELFDSGTVEFADQRPVRVPLGEIRTDEAGRLLVLGGFGAAGNPSETVEPDSIRNPGWFDDISDGPVTVTIRLRGDDSEPAVEGAWVIVAPPKFAPQQDSAITLFDALLSTMAGRFGERKLEERGLLRKHTSYVRDIQPVLQRAMDSQWVRENAVGHHDWSHPVIDPTRVSLIFEVLRLAGVRPAGTMPALNDDPAFTDIQSRHLRNWRQDNYDHDWADGPSQGELTPSGLDQAALDAAVGGSFAPGIEAGGDGSMPIFEVEYTAPFRVDHAAVEPGTLTMNMSVPWHSDFSLCGEGWWPVPRPNKVLVSGSSGSRQDWSRGLGSARAMIGWWSRAGFVVRDGDVHAEVGWDPTTVILRTTHLTFTDIPQRPLGMVREAALPVRFSVRSTKTVTLEFDQAGGLDPQLQVLTPSVDVEPAEDVPVEVALWVMYRTGIAPSTMDTQLLTVREKAGGQQWLIEVDANTVARRTTAVALVLERSAGMNPGKGAGILMADLQRQAAHDLIGVLLDGDGVAVIGYDDTGEQLLGLLPVTTPDDGNRQAAHDAVDAMETGSGGASLAAGTAAAREALAEPTGFDGTALVIVTDTAPDVTDIGDAYVAAVGTGQEVGLPELTGLARRVLLGQDGGSLSRHLLTLLTDVDDVQTIQTGGGSLDDTGERPETLTFPVTESDSGIEVIVLADDPGTIDLRVRAPSGRLIEPWLAAEDLTVQYGATAGAAYLRFALPVRLRDRYEHSGDWQLLVRRDSPRTVRNADDPTGTHRDHRQNRRRARSAAAAAGPVITEAQRAYDVARAQVAQDRERPATTRDDVEPRRGVRPYDALIRTHSNLCMTGAVRQDDYAPGAPITVTATLTQSDQPIDAATVTAYVTTSDAEEFTVELTGNPYSGRYEGSFDTTAAGPYQVRLQGWGRSRAGWPFTREHIATPEVWEDRGPGPNPTGLDLLRLLACLLDNGTISDELKDRLREIGIDLDRARECLGR